MLEMFHFSLFERKGVLTLLGFILLLVWVPDWYHRHWDPDDASEWVVHLHAMDEVPGGQTVSGLKQKPKASNTGKIEKKDTTTTTEGGKEISRAGEVAVKVWEGETEMKRRHIPPDPVFINQATGEQWMSLRGIGPVFSKRIVAFRQKLGGFVTIDQVSETYGLPDSVFQYIRPFLKLEQPSKKIRVNWASKEELAAHPYISWKQADVICLFRANHGPFMDQASFEVLHIFSEDEHNRLRPYLSFEWETQETR